MTTKHIKVLQGFSGPSGAYQMDDIKDVDAGLAEGWIMAGYAVEVDADGQPLAAEEKKEIAPLPKSPAVKKSSSSLRAPKTASPLKSKSKSSGKSMSEKNFGTGS